MDMSALPSVATAPEAASDEAVLASCELALDETVEKLQAYFENSGSWMETVLLTVGFYLLSIAVKAPEEFEILGAKINVAGDHRGFFLILIGIALVSRLVQGWMMSKLHADRINRSFEQVSAKLTAARDLLIDSVDENGRLVQKRGEEIGRETKLPEPRALFADDGMQALMDATSTYQGAPLTAETFRQAFADQIRSRRNALVARQLDNFYPIAEWDLAAEAAIAESLARHAYRFAPQVSVFAVTEEAATTISADKRTELARALDAALEKLRMATRERSPTSQDQLDMSSERLQTLKAKIGRLLRRAKFYQLTAKGGYFFHLALPTLAALFAAGAVVFSRV